LFPFIKFGKEDFSNTTFDVGHNFTAIFKGREILVNRIQVFFKNLVTVFFNVEDDAADVYAYILFHKDEESLG
jgi:hypothetical protein